MERPLHAPQLRRELQAERDAKILSSFDMLQSYSVRFEEYNADSE